jgi:hydroxymethylpyrimidine pyrophosphatase-like HAD family hydrolase
MFATAGRAYAMNHAIEPLKERAHGVLDASRGGGAVAEVAKKDWGI